MTKENKEASGKIKSIKATDYERLGRSLQSVFESGYLNHFRVYRINFVRGLFFGLGSVIGGTIVFAVLLWLLSLFAEVPFLGEVVDNIRNTTEVN